MIPRKVMINEPISTKRYQWARKDIASNIPIGQGFSLYSKKFLHLHTECSKFIDVSQTYFRLPNQPESTSQSSTFKKYIFFLNKLLSLGFHKKVSTN